MSYVKYTKTSTFLFPLLGIPKSLFQCRVESTFGNVIMTNRFLNSYLIDEDLDSKEFNEGPYLFLIIKNYRDSDFDYFYNTLTAFNCYVDEYERAGFLVIIFKIPDKFIIDYNLLKKGKYSKISFKSKQNIINNAFYSGKTMATLSLILNKSEKLKNSWEKRLSLEPRSVVDLRDKEVWSIIDLEKESFDRSLLKMVSKDQKMSPSREFK